MIRRLVAAGARSVLLIHALQRQRLRIRKLIAAVGHLIIVSARLVALGDLVLWLLVR